jgi:hypothetical protein
LRDRFDDQDSAVLVALRERALVNAGEGQQRCRLQRQPETPLRGVQRVRRHRDDRAPQRQPDQSDPADGGSARRGARTGARQAFDLPGRRVARAAFRTAGQPFFDGEGSRCRSNAAGTADFEAALRTNAKVPESERVALIAARRGFQPDCAQGGTLGAMAGIKSEAGKAFAAYLEGAAAFYGGDFDAATARFSALGTARDPWLRGTARYMLSRTAHKSIIMTNMDRPRRR